MSVHDSPDLRVAVGIQLLLEGVGLALDGARLAEHWLPAWEAPAQSETVIGKSGIQWG